MDRPLPPRPRAVLAAGFVLLAASIPARAQVSPEKSAAMLRPAEGLEASLWASEPMVVNPTTMDIDSRGRVWITEGLNYRLSRGGNRQFHRIEDADKIKILEDTDGDGKADKMTVFADKVFPVPMGLAVEEKYGKDGTYQGCKVYVGNSPDLLVLEDTDGDDKADKRYPLLTGFGGIDSDHGVHGMVLGLDGKLYFTHGDGCCSVQQDHSERTQNFDVVDKSGRHVSSDQLANTLRVNRDGTQFEIIADRQRNNYETANDSLGHGFTSDNDDDGNRGSRVIWVMDGGHYGYRTPGSARHWGEDTPGPVPKLVGTGNGSPCGIVVYEGGLGLPEEYRYSIFEAEAGPRVINYFPLQRHGAAFRTEHKILLSSDDPWFRPVDVTAAPDGSVFVADWYDGGVGGHAFRDQTTGRIYRVAAKGKKPARREVLGFGSPDWLGMALASPAVATRFAAREQLVAMEPGPKREAVIEGLKASIARQIRDWDGVTPPVILASRELWVLQAMAGDEAIVPALKAKAPQIREQAVRMLGRDVSRNGHVVKAQADAKTPPLRGEVNLQHLLPLVNDPDAGVRRELILAFRDLPTSKVGEALKTLAKGWDGQDRWYLEALGLALQGRESLLITELFDGNLYGDLDLANAGKDGMIAVPPYFPADRNEAYIKMGTPDQSSNALGKTLGLAWRLHRPEALPLIAKILPSLEAPELKQAAEDVLLQFGDAQAAVTLAGLVAKADDPARKNGLLTLIARKIGGDWKAARGDEQVVKAISGALDDPATRLAGIDAATASGDGRYGSVLMGFARDEKAPEEVRVAAIEAVGRLRPAKAAELLDGLIQSVKGKGASNAIAEAALRASAGLGGDAMKRLGAMIVGADYPLGLRREALRTYARSRDGSLRVLALARDGQLPEELKTEATTIVHRDPDRRVRSEAERLLPLPRTASGKPLPGIFELIRREGDAGRGQAVFFRSGANACASCHRVQGRGQWVGPDLSTIGSKYGKAELIQSVLNPSAAIGYNFRSTVASLADGRTVTGLVVEEAPDRLVLKTAEGQRVTFRPSEIEDRKQVEVSLMPEGLAQTMGEGDFVDLLAFLQTLKQPVSIVGQYQVLGPLADANDEAIASGAPTSDTWARRTADVEGQVDLRTVAGANAAKVAYLKTPVLAPESLGARLVLDLKGDVAAFLNGKPVALKAQGDGPRAADVRLDKGENLLVLRVAGGAQGGLVTTFVAGKPLEFR